VLLVEATERLMLEEGYAAVSSRRVAAEAGVKPALVHYYFPSMDDLFLAVLRRGAERNMARHEAARSSDRPLRAMWQLSREPHGTALLMEFAALANHRKAVRKEIAAYGRRYRRLQVAAVSAVFADYGIDDPDLTPEAVAVLMTGLANVLVLERTLGLRSGHKEAIALVEQLLDRFEPLR
jgi:AcrR family transcriptional regulator